MLAPVERITWEQLDNDNIRWFQKKEERHCH